MAFTDVEKALIRHHLGFPQLGIPFILALGVPAAGQSAFLIEDAMNRVTPAAEPKTRQILSECECIERQQQEARSRMRIAATGETVFRAREEMEDLESDYDLWTDKLVDIFGVNKNPFSKTHQRVSGEYIVINPS